MLLRPLCQILKPTVARQSKFGLKCCTHTDGLWQMKAQPGPWRRLNMEQLRSHWDSLFIETGSPQVNLIRKSCHRGRGLKRWKKPEWVQISVAAQSLTTWILHVWRVHDGNRLPLQICGSIYFKRCLNCIRGFKTEGKYILTATFMQLFFNPDFPLSVLPRRVFLLKFDI